VTAYHSPTMSDSVPSWVSLYNCFVLFVYQTMDAIDGKHARRTKASSPLGQLFDHGCDSLATLFIVLPCSSVAQLGPAISILLLLCNQIPFFAAQWEEYHTHSMRTNVNNFLGVTEGQHSVMMVYIASFIFGNDIWSWQFGPWSLCQMKYVLSIIFLFTCITMVSSNYNMVMTKAEDKGKAILQFLPLLLHVALAALWGQTLVFISNPWLGVSSVGGAGSHLTTQMIVCGLTHMDYDVKQWTVIVLPALVLISYVGVGSALATCLVAGYFMLVYGCIANYISGVIHDITHHLGIYCLKLGKRPKKD